MLEIERKFLVTSEAFKKEAFTQTRIVQGFLNTHPERTVRIRIKGDQGFITVKGKSNEAGTTRTEWEKEIDVKEAETLLKLCEEGVIEKTRYEVKLGLHIFEVDEFFGENEGLVIAEVELASENESFEKPKWVGKEVTGELKYYNSQLSKNPYITWNRA
jgi:adenylate cyclase